MQTSPIEIFPIWILRKFRNKSSNMNDSNFLQTTKITSSVKLIIKTFYKLLRAGSLAFPSIIKQGSIRRWEAKNIKADNKRWVKVKDSLKWLSTYLESAFNQSKCGWVEKNKKKFLKINRLEVYTAEQLSVSLLFRWNHENQDWDVIGYIEENCVIRVVGQVAADAVDRERRSET